ncbi:MAG TPA: NADPH:quinone oxidoreductase [Alphaproteobacteria bacterium]|nr:NADPH:quinone oxidoreductase [Alphaproteobacteria bacterium]
MKAAVVRALEPDFKGVTIAEMAVPEPQAGEVLVRMRAASVNFPDVLMTEGKYQHRPELPFILGLEGAGAVAALGPGVNGWREGDAVLVGARAGTFAEYVCAPASSLRPLPQGLSFAEGAAHTTALLTAYVALVRRAELAAGEWLLVHGAAGGVGLAAVDLGQHLGANVIAAASSQEKRDFLSARGFAHVIAPEPGFRDTVKALTQSQGADVIYDPVGGAVFDESVRCINFGGRLLSIGFASGTIPALPVNIALIKGFSLMGVRAGEYSRQYPERGRENLAAIDALASAGLKPHIGARFPLTEAVAALRQLSGRRAIGKVVVEMGA